MRRSPPQFWICENTRAHGHQATVHHANCRHCNHGQGINGGTRADNGRWIPATSVTNAIDVVTRTGANVKRCSVFARADATGLKTSPAQADATRSRRTLRNRWFSADKTW